MRRISNLGIGALFMSMAACASDGLGPPPPAPIDWHAFDVRPTPADAAKVPTVKERAVAESYAAALSSGQAVPGAPGASMASAGNTAAAGLGRLTPLLADDAHFLFPGGTETRGRDAVVHAHELLFGSFDARRVALTRVFRTDSRQLLEWTFAGTQTRDWLDVTATAKPVTFDGLTVLSTRDDGTISDVHVYFDVASVKAQLGAGPKPLVAWTPPWPSAPPQTFEQSSSPEELRNVAIVRAWLDALDAVDKPGYLGRLADDVELVTLESAQPIRGKDALLGYFQAVHREIAELDTRIDAVWGIGTFVAVEYSINGEQVAPIAWVPTVRDRVVRIQVADVLELRDGRITRISRYDNLAQANAP